MVAFFADFAPTSDNTNERLSWGWSVDEQIPAGVAAYNAYIGYVFSDQVPPKSRTDVVDVTAANIPGVGAWLYRAVPVAPVPTMNNCALFLIALGLIAIAILGLGKIRVVGK